jgi:hypothetical protein
MFTMDAPLSCASIEAIVKRVDTFGDCALAITQTCNRSEKEFISKSVC